MTTQVTNGAMIRSVPWVDRFAIGMSLLCIAHCLVMPILLVALPFLGTSFIGNQSFHFLLVYVIIPSSLFALGMGCAQHRRWLFFLIGLFGLSLLVLGISVERVGLNHIWEQAFTVFGGLFISFAHIRNFQQCREPSARDC